MHYVQISLPFKREWQSTITGFVQITDFLEARNQYILFHVCIYE